MNGVSRDPKTDCRVLPRKSNLLVRTQCLLAVGLPILIVFTACSAVGDFAHRQADRDANGIVDSIQARIPDQMTTFTLTGKPPEALREALAHARRVALDADAFATPTYCLSLADAVSIALAKNRDHQTSKDELFSRAVDLTGTRWDYGTNYTASGSLDYTRNDADGGGVEKFGEHGLTAGASRLLATGATVSLAYTHDFVRLISSGGGKTATNAFSLDVVQPLLRGAGPLASRETLTQAERDMVYAVREFARDEQSFVIDTIERYFNILSALDQLDNARGNLRSVTAYLDMLEIQVRHRTRAQLDADQAMQQVLSAETLVIEDQAEYQSLVDQFKVFLGVDLSLDIGSDRRELDELRRKGAIQPNLTLGESIDAALKTRLDYANETDRLEDERRHVEIALRDFLPSLDASYSFATTDERRHGLGLDFRDRGQTWGLNLGLPLDWTSRRNAYRQALLKLDKAQRTADEQHDQVIVDVRESWRQMDCYRRCFDLARKSAALVRRRVEGTRMMLAAGQTSAREMGDVQEELLAAQNDLTAVLVEYTIARLQFWYAIGRLEITGKIVSASASK